MKYTIKSFIKHLFGSDFKDIFIELGEDSYLYWDGDYIFINYQGESGFNEYNYDRLQFNKIKKNTFSFDINSFNYWYFTVVFKDGGFKKNKKYFLKNYIK